MSRRITMYFPDENILSFTVDEPDLAVGSWDSPYPNTIEDSTVFGLLEVYGQAPDSPVYNMAYEYGEPIRVVISERNPDVGDAPRVVSDAELRVLSNPEAAAALRENKTTGLVDRPARKPWEREGFVSEP